MGTEPGGDGDGGEVGLAVDDAALDEGDEAEGAHQDCGTGRAALGWMSERLAWKWGMASSSYLCRRASRERQACTFPAPTLSPPSPVAIGGRAERVSQ